VPCMTHASGQGARVTPLLSKLQRLTGMFWTVWVSTPAHLCNTYPGPTSTAHRDWLALWYWWHKHCTQPLKHTEVASPWHSLWRLAGVFLLLCMHTALHLPGPTGVAAQRVLCSHFVCIITAWAAKVSPPLCGHRQISFYHCYLHTVARTINYRWRSCTEPTL
jgi:hypothetical protein